MMDGSFTDNLLNCSCRPGRQVPKAHTMNTAFKIFLLVGAVLYGVPGLVWWINHRRAVRARQDIAAVGVNGSAR